jgi:hypothetical protein
MQFIAKAPMPHFQNTTVRRNSGGFSWRMSWKLAISAGFHRLPVLLLAKVAV